MFRIKEYSVKVAPAFIVGAAMLWGSLVIFVRQLDEVRLSSMEIVALRVYCSATILVLGLLIYDRGLLKIKWKDIWCFTGAGIVSIVFFSYCYFKNVTISSAAVSSILLYTSPIWVSILSRLVFKEPIGRKKLMALFMALVGCGLVCGIAGGVGNVRPEGILLGLGSGIGYGLYSIFGRIALEKGYHPMTVSAYTFLFACVGVLPFLNLSDLLAKMNQEPSAWIWVLATTEPIVTSLVGVMLYQEILSPTMIIGIAFILIASIIIGRG